MTDRAPVKPGSATDQSSAPRPEVLPDQDHGTVNVVELSQYIVLTAKKSFLGTIDKSTDHPHVSLVAVATTRGGVPVFLLSSLARHTQNLLENPKVSVFFDATGDSDDVMAGDRITVFGTIIPLDNGDDQAEIRDRFLSNHPTAIQYIDFSDFRFYKLCPESAHFVGGFGRIVEIAGQDLVKRSDGR
ncbi:MAG: HugZ family protein [Hyphomicrobiaceae bacterium]